MVRWLKNGVKSWKKSISHKKIYNTKIIYYYILNSMASKYMGEQYKYSKNIKSNKEMKMSNKGSWGALKKNVRGIAEYNDLLISGDSKASKAKGGPLGNKYFIESIGYCAADDGSDQVRYMYIDNVPDGDIKVLSDLGINVGSNARGLLPGLITSGARMNPMGMLTAVQNPTKLPCQEVTLKTGDVGATVNNKHYVANQDIQQINPCNFSKNRNTLTKKKCERFAGSRRMADPNAMHDTTSSTRAANRKEKFLQIYYSFIVLFVGFLVYKLMVKNKLL
jgi:hypothetical protein